MPEIFQRVQPAGEIPTGREFLEAELRLERVVNRVAAKPSNDGVLIQGVVLEVGFENCVAHGLGRKFLSWTVCDRRGNLGCWRRVDTSAADLSKYIPIAVTTPLTVDIMVF